MELRKAEGDLIEHHAGEVPALVWSTGPVSYEYHFGRRALFDAVVQASWHTAGTLFGADAATLALGDGALLGLAITMPGPEFRSRGSALAPLWQELLAADAVQPDEVAGVVERSRLASWLNPALHSSTWYIHAIAVTPEARGQRIGVQLMEHALETAKERGCRELQLDVLSDNPAVGFYRSLGLEVLAETRAPKPAEFGVPPELRMGIRL